MKMGRTNVAALSAVLTAVVALPVLASCEHADTDGTLQAASETSVQYTSWSDRPDRLWPEGVNQRYTLFVASEDGQLTLFGVDGGTQTIVFAYVGEHADGPAMKCQLGDESLDAGEGSDEANLGIPMTIPKGPPKGPGGIPGDIVAAVLSTVDMMQAVAQESAAQFEGLEL